MREVSNDQKKLLYEKLSSYRESLLPDSTNHFLPVGSTTILFEFDNYQINQILQNRAQLFNMQHIINKIELWRNIHANNVFLALNEVFDDMDKDCQPLLLSESDFEEMEVVVEEWEEIRDDDSRAEMFDDS